MGTVTKKYRLNQKVKDDLFNVDALHHYDLCLELGLDGFRVCIVDTQQSRCLWLEDYRFSSVVFTEQLLSQLQQIYDEHPTLRAGFWKCVRVVVRNQPYTLVPGSLFKRENADQYLSLLRDETPFEPEEIQHYHHPNRDVVSIFPLETTVGNWFQRAYPSLNVKFVHQSSAFIEGVVQNGTHAQPRSMYICVEGSYLTVVVTREEGLEFCNTFFYASAPDFVYYVLFVMSELKMNSETSRVSLYGTLTHDSAVFEQLHKYIRHVSFGTKPKSLRFSYPFDEVLDHYYFSAYTTYLCE